jgi:hypothetical protein
VPKIRKPTVQLSIAGKLKVTRIEAAVFQLETAIWLWFNEADTPSITVLAYASFELLYQMEKANLSGPRTDLKAPDRKHFKDNQLLFEQWKQVFSSDYDFCRHGGGNPLDVHYFTVLNLPRILIAGVGFYARLGFKERANFKAMTLWMRSVEPIIFAGADEYPPHELEIMRGAEGMQRRAFFSYIMPFLGTSFSTAGSPVLRD